MGLVELLQVLAKLLSLALTVYSRFGPHIGSALSRMTLLLPYTIWQHRRETQRRLNQLPFRFRDVDTRLIDAYVQARLRPLPLDDLNPFNANEDLQAVRRVVGVDELWHLEERASYDSLQRCRRAILFGQAGVGKTTFATYSMLIASSRSSLGRIDHPLTSRDLVPIYVPLKVLKNDGPFPILRYIVRSNRLISSLGGHRRLLTLLRRRRLFIVLDGYDEIYISHDTNNHITAEIDAVMRGVNPQPLTRSLSEFELKFYLGLRDNIVWLTTRTEFYAHNRLTEVPAVSRANRKWFDLVYFGWLDHEYADLQASLSAHHDVLMFSQSPVAFYLATVQITGVVDRRTLVQHIFDRNERGRHGPTALEPETFLHMLNETLDDEGARLTSNPLFLTVICYLFLDRSGQPTDRTVPVSELIAQCTQMLLQDIDRQKLGRLMSEALSARLSHSTEKLDFVKFFAARLYFDPRLSEAQVFTESDLHDSASMFFSERAPELARLVKKRSPDSIVFQLIHQSVFAIVDTSRLGTFYDFPHRRFREVLAVQYLDSPEGYQECRSHLRDPSIRELLLVFFNQSRQYQDPLLRETLQRIDGSNDGQYYASLAVSLIESSPTGYDPTHLLVSWLETAISSARPKELTKPLAGAIATFPLAREAVKNTSLAAASGGDTRCRTALLYLAEMSPPQFKETIAYLFKYLSADSVSWKAVIEVALRYAAEEVQALLLRESEWRECAEIVMATDLGAAEAQFWFRVLFEASDVRCADLIDVAGSQNAAALAKLERAADRRRQIKSLMIEIARCVDNGEVNLQRPDGQDEVLILKGTSAGREVLGDVVIDDKALKNVNSEALASDRWRTKLAQAVLRGWAVKITYDNGALVCETLASSDKKRAATNRPLGTVTK